jgi:hypothetical protein
VQFRPELTRRLIHHQWNAVPFGQRKLPHIAAQTWPEQESAMNDLFTNPSLIVGAFIFVLALIIAVAAFLDRGVLQPFRFAAKPQGPPDTAPGESE